MAGNPLIAPIGFHYFGEDSTMLESGLPSIPIRRTLMGSSGQALTQFNTYRDLYCIISPEKWVCCVFGCPHRSDKGIVMSTHNGKTKIYNFMNHLKSCHPALLVEKDITFDVYGKKRSAGQMQMGNYVIVPPVVAVAERPKIQHQSHKVTEKKRLIINAGVKAICHGPYPINIFINPAMQHFMIELLGADRCDIPSYNTLKKYVDEFLANEKAQRENSLQVCFFLFTFFAVLN